jgi:polar amino acid transport system ATP-binding protein
LKSTSLKINDIARAGTANSESWAKVMLFDEVTSALDPELCGEVLNVIRRLGREHDLTMLMVTHQMGFAKEFADRVCFFSQGKIIEQAPPQQFFAAPQHERTQQFLRAVREAT